ncbi:MAG: DUF4248 domain-containing protein [Bacteroidales bacterium]|nr:DUF4248 domain-containing protein [Bacteroidales bacterium]
MRLVGHPCSNGEGLWLVAIYLQENEKRAPVRTDHLALMLRIIRDSCLETEFPLIAMELVAGLVGTDASFGEKNTILASAGGAGLVSKGDYAEQKFPHCARSTALKKLANTIRSNPRLASALRDAGYSPNSHTLTLRQVRVIEEGWREVAGSR